MRVLSIVVIMLIWPLCVFADITKSNKTETKPLVVGIKHAPPFVIKLETGQWSGISVELWRYLSAELDFKFQLRETELTGLLAGIEKGELDAVVGAITVTAERSKRMDFSHPFYTSGLSIAVPAQPGNVWLAVLKGFFTWQFISVVTALFLLLLIIGILVWFFEHKHNQQFNGPSTKGIGSGFWWSAVTMTTVGYGDKAPMTLGGRSIALLWMFASIIIISSFTAAITSALTVGQLATGITGPQDLYSNRTGTVLGSSSEEYLQSRHINYLPYNNANEGLQALANGEIQAFVYDQPLLQYLSKSRFQGQVDVLPNNFRRQDYAIALPQGSSLKEDIDQQLLQHLESPAWQKQLARYLGLEVEL